MAAKVVIATQRKADADEVTEWQILNQRPNKICE
jgi:hypothetical protein